MKSIKYLVLSFLLLGLISIKLLAQVGTWPTSTNYLYLGANELNQNNSGNYAVLQDKTTGQTFFNSPHSIYFRIGNGDRMFLSSGGNLGIGTTSPYQWSGLHVKSLGAYPWSIISEASSNDKIIGFGHNGAVGLIATSYLGSGGHSPIRFVTSDQPRMTIETNGFVGLGTITPNAPFHVKGSGFGSHLSIETDAGGHGDLQWFQGGTNPENQRAAFQVNESSGDLEGWVYSSSWNRWLSVSRPNAFVGFGIQTPTQRIDLSGRIKFRSDNLNSSGIWFTGADGSEQAFIGQTFTTSASPIGIWHGGAWRFQVDNAGNIGIGTLDPKGYKLAIAGKVIAEEVTVKLQSAWPDYVFEKNYKLPSLKDVESFINQNKHLPEVPSAKEVESTGINVGELNMLLLKKIEELTLYIIQLDQIVEKQNNKIESLEKKTRKL